MTTRVVLADDEVMIRAGLRLLLEGEVDLEVVGEASDGRQAVAVVMQERPHVVLMDVRMPHADGLSAAREVLERCPGTAVVVLTTFDEDAYVDEALRLGVSGFLLKTASPEQLLDAVRRAASGQALLDPAVTARVIAGYAAVPAPPTPAPELARLTDRETEVLRLVAQGLNNPEIAARLFLGEATVKTHFGRVLHKLELRDRAQAVAFAYESGLVVPGAP
jgi:DNA-binding NarL/FixJ family response regulator